MQWLFQTDYGIPILKFLSKCGFPEQSYRTDEREILTLVESPRPVLTGYRLLVSSLDAGFGLNKAFLSFRGYSMDPTTADWVFGVVGTMGYATLSVHADYISDPLLVCIGWGSTKIALLRFYRLSSR